MNCFECGEFATLIVKADSDNDESYWCVKHGLNKIGYSVKEEPVESILTSKTLEGFTISKPTKEEPPNMKEAIHNLLTKDWPTWKK
jgi:hypothetical protein